MLSLSLATLACSNVEPAAPSAHVVAPEILNGTWIREADGTSMLNPQTSGLIAAKAGLWTISDASADTSQIQRLHLLDKLTGEVLQRLGPMQLSESVQSSCFASYLTGRPDYEAIIAHPFLANAWVLVTEDATRSEPLSAKCAQDYAQTGSTDYPTLLVELRLVEDALLISGVRAIQFDLDAGAGNLPNDGIEGMALGKNNMLYMGLEKDAEGKARIFEVLLSEGTFNGSVAFLPVTDAMLNLPVFEQGAHPINGMDIYYPNEESPGYLLAAARNDNQLWVIDVSKLKPTVIVPLTFFSNNTHESCQTRYEMDNASLEGVAVDGDTIFLINDPWKRNYLKNVNCESEREKYERMSPLLFSLPVKAQWFG